MPESGTQLIADLLYVAPQLAMHNLVTYQVDEWREGTPRGAMHLSLFLRFWQCWKCCEKDMDILS